MATVNDIKNEAIGNGFYPRHPRGWRRKFVLMDNGAAEGFYPRHPRGWRPCTLRSCRQYSRFLSTPPSRVATVLREVSMYLVRFLSTPPSRVATIYWRRLMSACNAFLSTPPSRVATKRGFFAWPAYRSFYPRHPRGWRLTTAHRQIKFRGFLSTPPSRVATLQIW